MNKAIFKYIVCYSILLSVFNAEGAVHKFRPQEKLSLKISKSGLNRISNPPYRITQLTGDDGKFRIKYDEDGSNIYFIPLVSIGEIIEVSIKNNAGHVQDLELNVANIKGRSIVIDSTADSVLDKAQKSDIAEMLRAMKDNVESKFYVQKTNQKLDDINALKVRQVRIYRYKNLAGGVFAVKNTAKRPITLNTNKFAKRFGQVKSFYPEISVIQPKQETSLLIVQEVGDK